jgi:flagellar hook-associated protein 1 FlgK
MQGLFGTLNLGARSLAAQQLATQTAGHNLANVNNPAYSRQRVDLATSPAVAGVGGLVGTGVDAIAVTQLRDYLLDRQITSESSVSGSLNAQQQALQYAQSFLGEQLDSSTTGTQGADANNASSIQSGLAERLTELFSAFQNLALKPDSATQRLVLIQTAQTLATQFNQVAGRLTTVNNGLNTNIQDDVGSANQLMSDIAKLNQQIIYTEGAAGGVANDLRDTRQSKLEQLAKLTNVSVTEQANGGWDVSVGGVTMVSGMNVQDTLEAYDAGGGQMMVRAQTAGTPLTLTGGSIQGTIDVRDGALATLRGNIDTLAGQLITQVNTIHSAGFDLNGGTGQNFFTGTDAATLGVNSALVADPSMIQASGNAGATGDNSVALALAGLANAAQAGLGNQTFTQNFSATVAALGQSLASVNDQTVNQSAVTSMLSNQRSSISGVNIDEEMTNLMAFQKAFDASAKLISTVNDMLITVVNMKVT